MKPALLPTQSLSRRYYGDWNSIQDVRNDMSGCDASDSEVVFAYYELDGYEGSATVIINRGGMMLDASDSHCSCNGMSWYPQPTTYNTLCMQDLGYRVSPDAAKAFRQLFPSSRKQ